MTSETVSGRRVFLGGVMAVFAVTALSACADAEVILAEWSVGQTEHGHTLFGFAQVKGGLAKVVLVRSTDEHGRSFSGPLIVSMPRLASERYNPASKRALEFQVWNERVGEWQWLGVSTLDRLVQKDERYRLVLTEGTVVDVETTSVSDDLKERVAEETAWAEQFDV